MDSVGTLNLYSPSEACETNEDCDDIWSSCQENGCWNDAYDDDTVKSFESTNVNSKTVKRSVPMIDGDCIPSPIPGKDSKWRYNHTGSAIEVSPEGVSECGSVERTIVLDDEATIASRDDHGYRLPPPNIWLIGNEMALQWLPQREPSAPTIAITATEATEGTVGVGVAAGIAVGASLLTAAVVALVCWYRKRAPRGTYGSGRTPTLGSVL